MTKLLNKDMSFKDIVYVYVVEDRPCKVIANAIHFKYQKFNF